MGKYTKRGKNIDEFVQKQLDTICSIVKEEFDPLSIILVGGFGRGEGGVFVKGNKFTPVNDYDLYVITEKKISSRKLERVSVEVNRQLGKKGITFKGFDKDYTISQTFYPDIRSITLKKLRKLLPLLKYYEMKNGGITLYGKNLLLKMPKIRIEDVPIQEGFRFLMNRVCLQAAFFSREQRHIDGLINFTTKTALSCAEALLLLSGKYVASYEKRAKLLSKSFEKDFPEIRSEIPTLHDFVKKFTDFKLLPNYSKIRNPIAAWHEARMYSFVILKHYLKVLIGKKENTPEEVAELMSKKVWRNYAKGYVKLLFPQNIILDITAGGWMNLAYILRVFWKTGKLYLRPLWRFWVPPELKIYAAAIMFIFSHDKGKIDEERLRLARYYLREVFPVSSQEVDVNGWEKFRQEFGDSYSIYEHMKVI